MNACVLKRDALMRMEFQQRLKFMEAVGCVDNGSSMKAGVATKDLVQCFVHFVSMNLPTMLPHSTSQGCKTVHVYTAQQVANIVLTQNFCWVSQLMNRLAPLTTHSMSKPILLQSMVKHTNVGPPHFSCTRASHCRPMSPVVLPH